MPDQKWHYFKRIDERSVLKTDSAFFGALMFKLDYIRCSYFEYLRVMKLVEERELDIEVREVGCEN